jgi:hypothetical protein
MNQVLLKLQPDTNLHHYGPVVDIMNIMGGICLYFKIRHWNILKLNKQEWLYRVHITVQIRNHPHIGWRWRDQWDTYYWLSEWNKLLKLHPTSGTVDCWTWPANNNWTDQLHQPRLLTNTLQSFFRTFPNRVRPMEVKWGQGSEVRIYKKKHTSATTGHTSEQTDLYTFASCRMLPPVPLYSNHICHITSASGRLKLKTPRSAEVTRCRSCCYLKSLLML